MEAFVQRAPREKDGKAMSAKGEEVTVSAPVSSSAPNCVKRSRALMWSALSSGKYAESPVDKPEMRERQMNEEINEKGV